MYQRSRMRGACAGTYKYLRPPRAPRLPAPTAPRTSNSHRRRRPPNKNTKPKQDVRTRARNKIKEKNKEYKPLDMNNAENKKYKPLDMNNAELYQQSNRLQKRDALQCLKEYEKKFQWKRFERVLDIGCGDGGVTTDILKKYIPRDFQSLTGCDISEKMVKFANDHHGDERVTFTVLDIEGQLPPCLKAGFEHAYSFYTLHWIRDQERAFNNIYDLLVEEGECLLIFLGHMPLFDVFRKLARQPKWREWIINVDRFVSPYHDSQDPEKDIKRVMAKTGFRNIEVQIKEKSFSYNDPQDCKKAVSAVNPFPMPLDVEEQFLDEYLKVARDMRLIDELNNNLEKPHHITMNYTLIVAYGKKQRKVSDDS